MCQCVDIVEFDPQGVRCSSNNTDPADRFQMHATAAAGPSGVWLSLVRRQPPTEDAKLPSGSDTIRTRPLTLPFASQIFPSCTNRTDVLLLIGAVYYQLGSYEQCIAFNDRCILLDPHMAEAHANLANALQQIGNFDMALIY